jgi:putative transcriptional regulator
VQRDGRHSAKTVGRLPTTKGQDMTFGEELIQSAKEALAIAKDKAEPAAIFVPKTIDVAALKKKQKLSLSVLTAGFGLFPEKIKG